MKLHEDVGTLRRHPKPETVNGFPAAAAVPVPIVCLPNDRREPAVAALGWDEETWGKFSKVVNSYNAVRNHQLGSPRGISSWATPTTSSTSWTRLRPGTCSSYSSSRATTTRRMCWGDGGFIYFWADPRDIAAADLTKIDTDCQGG